MTLDSRSAYVKNGKVALLVFAAIMAISIIVIANIMGGEKGGRLVFSGNEKTENNEPRMVNPRYYGIDSKNRPFSVNASSATQKEDGTIELQDVSADMLLDQKSWLALTANHGIIQKDSKVIVLTDKVSMFYDGGYEFRSDYAKIFTEEGRAEGDQPVAGQSPTGTLKADSFRVTDRGQKLYFKGHVDVHLYLK